MECVIRMFFSDIDNDVGGGGDAAYLHTCQYIRICVYMMACNAYILYLMARTNAKNILQQPQQQQTLFGLDDYRLNPYDLE